MVATAISGFVDGFFKGRGIRDAEEQRELDRARQKRLDEITFERHDMYKDQQAQLAGIRDSQEARAAANHAYEMGVRQEQNDLRQQERDLLAGVYGVAPDQGAMPSPRASDFSLGAATEAAPRAPVAAAPTPTLGFGVQPAGDMVQAGGETDSVAGGLWMAPAQEDRLTMPAPANVGVQPVSGQMTMAQALDMASQREPAPQISAEERTALSFGLRPGERFTEAQAERGAQAYSDHFNENAVPKLMDFYTRTGQMEKAIHMQEFMNTRQAQIGTKQVGKAMFLMSIGDVDGAANAFIRSREAFGDLDGNIDVDEDATGPIRDQNGAIVGSRIVYVDANTGNKFEQTFNSVDEFAAYAHELTNPAAVAEREFERKNKQRRIVKGADGKQYYEDTGQAVLPDVAPAPKDEYERYVLEEQEAGREPLSRIDYVQAKKGKGTVVYDPDTGKPLVSIGGGNDDASDATNPSSPAAMIASIDGILNDPALDFATGWLSWTQNIPGTGSKRFGARAKQLEGQAFLQAFESLKGGGHITEIEGQKATDAIGRLTTAQGPDDYRDALTELRGLLTLGMDRSMGLEETGSAETAPEPAEAGATPTITDDASFEALPSGAVFRDPEGNLRKKP